MSDAFSDYIDRLFDPIVRCFTPAVAERILDLELDPAVRRRLDDLAAKAEGGTLTEDEHAEYDNCVNVIDFIAVLQSKSRDLLQ